MTKTFVLVHGAFTGITNKPNTKMKTNTPSNKRIGKNTKIVVIGGSGLIGKKLVKNLRQQGHEVVAASPSSGVNSVTGEGLADALAGAHVVVDVEPRVVLPVQHPRAHARPHDALVKTPEGRKPFVEQRAQSLDVDPAVERHDAGDHHQVGWVFHPQPGRVDARHGDEPGHRPVILRGIDGDFRGLHRHPDVCAGGEVQLADR